VGLVFAKIADPNPGAPTLQRGGSNKAANLSWQNILVALGYGPTVGKPDGIFGAGTEMATKALQSYGAQHYRDTKPIGIDGTVGPQTRRLVVARTAELTGTVIGGRRRRSAA
jgi:peptidoglycan hydrolase-like protein with peptidoglycan-binding domain